MDLTQGTQGEKNSRAKKMMLWFGIISLIMSFAGWTSAFVVSSARPDWLKDFQLPNAFIVSTIVIVISSFPFILAQRCLLHTSAAADEEDSVQTGGRSIMQKLIV